MTPLRRVKLLRKSRFPYDLSFISMSAIKYKYKYNVQNDGGVGSG